jgi:agmatine/peptidylarginine deiminase
MLVKSFGCFSTVVTILFFTLFPGVLPATAETPSGYPTLEQQREWEENNPNSLPHWMTPEELQRLDEIGRGFEPTEAPEAPIRQPAEFEPMQGVLIRYPFGISYNIIAEMSEDVEVVTIVSGTSQQNYVHSQYQSHGVNTDNCSYLIAPTDSYWARDYGPWFMINGSGVQGIVDCIYNRPRPNDDDIPAEYGGANGIPVYGMDLRTAGGNYMTDGQGIAVSTDLVWSENPGKTHTEIDQMVLDYLGIQTYHVVPDALGEYIEHIDCWAKYLSPDTIMIIEVPQSHSQYDELEEAVDYFESRMNCYGTPYNVVRVYAPNGQPYVNSLILNDKVLVPTTGSSWDDDAIASYETAMPGYEVLGFSGSWYSTDAIHCRAMGITDRYMLSINHTPLRNGAPSEDGFLVEAEVIPYSGEVLVEDTPVVYWIADSTWNAVTMESSGGYEYEAYIPPYPHGTDIHYFIHAEDSSGKSENHPYIGPLDAHSFTVYDPILTAHSATLSAIDGGTVSFALNGGPDNANRNYVLLASISGTEPGFQLPGGHATLPLNWDRLSNLVAANLNSPVLSDFQGTLDENGRATAQLNIGPMEKKAVGLQLYFAYALYYPWDFVSEPVLIEIVE